MSTPTEIPAWEALAEHLRISLGYTDATLTRTKYTYGIFVNQFCGTKGDPEGRIERGIEQIGNTFEAGKISKDKLLRLRRVAFRMLQLIKSGEITWERAPLYGKKFGNTANEELLASYVNAERRGHKHAESIIRRDENIIRKYILYAERHRFNLVKANAQNIITFLSHMKMFRTAGLKSTTSALKHFYLYLAETQNADPKILLAIKPWDTPHKRVYGIFTNEEKQKLLYAIDSDSIQENDKAVLMLAIDCGLRSSDLCHLKLKRLWRNIGEYHSEKTGNQVTIPFSKETGDAGNISCARGHPTSPIFPEKVIFRFCYDVFIAVYKIKKALAASRDKSSCIRKDQYAYVP